MHIRFEQANHVSQSQIFAWLDEPHMKEFWDNSQEHKEDILKFINGRIEPSNYFYGRTFYWVGLIDDQPFCFLLTSEVDAQQDDLTDLQRAHLSQSGSTISVDFGIGNKDFLGKGLAAKTLEAFVVFFNVLIDQKADTFFIDPDENNPKAIHVYEKAGFKMVGDFNVLVGVFKGSKNYLMVKKLERS